MKEKKLEVIYKGIDEIIPYINNPRHNEAAIDKVAASIAEFGFKVPIVIDRDNVIVTGHTRREAALKLRLKEIPCIYADDLTPAQIKAFRIADNKTSEYASWDKELLKNELDGLDELNFDWSSFDFDFDVGEIDIEEKPERQSISMNETISVVVNCDDDEQAENLFNRLIEEGYECHISTL